MIEKKRFIISKDERNPVIEEITNGMLLERYITIEEIINKLNELYDENIVLKQENENHKEFIKAQPIAKSDGEITKVNTEEFIKICQENDRLSQSNQTKDNYIVEIDNDRRKLLKENEELKKVLGTILIEVRREINYLNRTAEIKVFINPNSYNLIEEVLTEYSSLNGNEETS